MKHEDETPGSTDSSAEDNSIEDNSADEGAGCLPALLAMAVLSGIISLVVCAVGTWFIYQNRDQLALRSVRGAFVPAIEQSLLEPEEKTQTVEMLREFADDIERGKVEAWQASGVMQRITRLPIFQWGQVRALERYVAARPDDFESDALVQFRRLRRGVERGDLTTIDFQHILSPAVEVDDSPSGSSLLDPIEVERVREVVKRARGAADRSGVAPDPRQDVTIDTLVRRQIEAGIEEGSF